MVNLERELFLKGVIVECDREKGISHEARKMLNFEYLSHYVR